MPASAPECQVAAGIGRLQRLLVVHSNKATARADMSINKSNGNQGYTLFRLLNLLGNLIVSLVNLICICHKSSGCVDR